MEMEMAISPELTLAEFVAMRISDIFDEVAQLVGVSELSEEEAAGVALGLFRAEYNLQECWRYFVDKKGGVNDGRLGTRQGDIGA